MGTERVAGERRWRIVRGAGRRRWPLRALLPYGVVLVVLAVAGGLGWVVYGTTVFAAEHVRVEGARTVAVADIVRVAMVPTDVPLAQLDASAVAGRVEKLKPITSARVTRSWPSTVTISVTERSAVAVFAGTGGYALVDGHGVVFRTVAQRPALPEIAVAHAVPGDGPTEAAIAVAESLSPQLRAKLRRITAPTAEQVTLELTDGRTVFWGDDEDNVRKATVTAALLGRPGRRLDVSAPDVVTVR